MSELNLHGRLPNHLPDKMTINDILLELEDTNKFDINLINLPSFDLVEQGEVRICEADYSSMRFNLDPNTPSVLTIKETLYHVVRYPMRLSVNSKMLFYKDAEEICEASNEVYLRLKDYLGPDVIQDQFRIMDFTIDFMISRCKII